jgi:AbrB family looped-hinge helix DNA binding protein
VVHQYYFFLYEQLVSAIYDYMDDTFYSLVSTKGQVVIPAELRAELKIEPGTRICFQRAGDILILRPVTDRLIDRLRGFFKGGPSLSALREPERGTDPQ